MIASDEWIEFREKEMEGLTDMSKILIYDKILSSRTIEIKDIVYKPGLSKTPTEINRLVKDLNDFWNFYENFEINEDRFFKLNNILNEKDN